jgi:hypothetical protein
MMDYKPWSLLDPNDFQSMWWRKNEIIDNDKLQTNKELTDILAYIIIQDGNMGGIFWYTSTWYINDPNRYNSMIFESDWPFNKELTDMKPGDIVYLTENQEIQFNVNYSSFGLPNQRDFCKILERINS